MVLTAGNITEVLLKLTGITFTPTTIGRGEINAIAQGVQLSPSERDLIRDKLNKMPGGVMYLAFQDVDKAHGKIMLCVASV